MNVKVSFVLSQLPTWHLAGMPKWNFEFLSETRRQGVAFIHLSFLCISLLYFCLSPDRERPVFSGSGYQPKPAWVPLLCTVAHTAGHLVGGMRGWVRPCQKTRASAVTQSRDLSGWSGAQSRKKHGPWATNCAWVHQQCSVKRVKQASLDPPQGKV